MRPHAGVPATSAHAALLPARPGLARRLCDRALARPTWVFVLAVYLISRLLVAVIVQGAAMCCQPAAGVHDLHPDYLDMVPIWDGQWYREIAGPGYPLPVPFDADTGQITYSAWAFYPVFPLLVRALVSIGLPFTGAALLLNLAAGSTAAVLLWRLLSAAIRPDGAPGSRLLHERMALLATVLWCLYPATAVLQVAYSEAVAMALLAAFLLLLVRRRYLAAAAVVVVLGFTRAIAPPLALVVLVHVVLRWRAERRGQVSALSGQRVSALILLAATAASALAWPLVVGLVTGRLDTFFVVQASWGQEPTRGPFVAWLTWAWGHLGVVGVVLFLSLVAAYVSLVTGRHGRWLAVELRAWALAYPLFLLAVVRPITSMWRFLLLDFPLAAVVASIAVRGAHAGPLLPTWPRRLAVVGAGLVAGVVVWTVILLTYTPWFDTPP